MLDFWIISFGKIYIVLIIVLSHTLKLLEDLVTDNRYKFQLLLGYATELLATDYLPAPHVTDVVNNTMNLNQNFKQ